MDNIKPQHYSNENFDRITTLALFIADCERLRLVSSRDVVTPTSVQGGGADDSADPSIDTFDNRRFRNLIPKPPHASSSDPEDD